MSATTILYILLETMDDIDATSHCREKGNLVILSGNEYIEDPCTGCMSAYKRMRSIVDRLITI